MGIFYPAKMGQFIFPADADLYFASGTLVSESTKYEHSNSEQKHVEFLVRIT